tara:strand:+ start:431 stop:601 length:171 start_codon:yes stop_codon:yes gene_type:complete
VENIFSQTTAFSAYTTIVTVVYVLVGIVVPELANTTEIPSCSLSTVDTELTSPLST